MLDTSSFSTPPRGFFSRSCRVRITAILTGFLLFFITSCQQGGGNDSGPSTRTATVNLSTSFDGGSASIAGPNYNALGTMDDIASVTVKIVRASDNFIIKPETNMTESSTDVNDWSLSFSDIPTEVELKYTANAFNASGTVIFTDVITRTLSTAETSVSIEFQMESIDDEIEPTNPVIVSATIPTSIYANTVGAIIVFDVSHDSDFLYEVSVVNGSITSLTSGTHNPASDLAVAYTAPAVSGEDTITLQVRDADSSSDIVSASYPINVVDEPVPATVGMTVLFGPAITGISYARSSDDLRATVQVDASTDVTYLWSGTDDFSDVSADTNLVIISSYDDSDVGTLTITVTDENGIQASLTRSIAAGNFNYTLIPRAEPDRTLPDTNQVTSYTDTFGEDADYGLPHYFTDNGNGTVIDNKTLLVWQQEDDGVTRNWSAAVNYCADATFDGIADWRLPHVKELQSIVDYEYANLTVDPSIFPETGDTYYWTADTDAENATLRWVVDFAVGHVITQANGLVSRTRCVHSDSIDDIWGGDFVVVNDGTIYHPATKLTWQRSDNDASSDWEDALMYCEDSTADGFSDWRLPNIRELQSIGDYSVYSPAIDSTVFPGTTDSYWSSTTRAIASGFAVVYDSDLGMITNDNKTASTSTYTRCVRGGE